MNRRAMTILAGVMVVVAAAPVFAQQAQTTPVPMLTNTPRAFAFPATNTPRMPTVTPSPTYAPPTYTPTPIVGATWTAPAPDPAREIADHYVLARPLSDNAANYISWTYPYGGTSGGRLQMHYGVDFGNPTGTAVLAAADGVVLYAGDDLAAQFGPINNFYGRLVVIQHNIADSSGGAIYTLYGHLDAWDVSAGETVTAGQRIGVVGATGVAQGPHLHFEVRVGNPYDYGATRNPVLWMFPYWNYGTLVGRVTDANGALLYNTTLTIEPTGGLRGPVRYAFSYAEPGVNGDSRFGENWLMGDLPAGYYVVTVGDGGRVRYRETVYVAGNRSTWLDVQLR